MLILRNALLTISLGVLASYSSDFRNWDTNSGKGAFAFITTFQGARATAMSEAGGSLPTQDPFAVFLNPAAVQASTFHHQFALSWQMGALARQQGTFAWNFPWRMALLQTTVGWTTYDALEGTNEENGEPISSGTTYQPSNQCLALTGIVPTSHFRLGATLKMVRDHLSDDAGDQDALGWALDWGIQPRQQFPSFGWGISVLNVGSQTRAYTKGGVDSLALDTRIRASVHYHPAPVRGLTLAMDAELPRYTQPLTRLAVEYTPKPWIQLRAGSAFTMAEIGTQVHKLFSDSTVSSSNTANLSSWGSAGAGLVWKDYTIDYSITLLRNELGQMHRLGLRTGF